MSVEGGLLGLGAAAAWGFADVGATIASRRVGSTRTTGVIVPVSAALLIGTFLIMGAQLPADPATLLGSAALGLFGSVIYFTAFAALRAGPITLVGPILGAFGGVTVLFAILFLGEEPSPLNLLAAVGATVGVVLAGIAIGSTGRLRVLGPGVRYALIALLVASGQPIIASLVIEHAGWLPALTVARSTNAAIVVVVLFVIGRRRQLRERARGSRDAVDPTSVALTGAGRRTIAILLAASAVEFIAVACFFAGLAAGPTWLVGLTSSFAPLIVIGAGLWLFRERPRPLQWAGIALVLVSTVFLASR